VNLGWVKGILWGWEIILQFVVDGKKREAHEEGRLGRRRGSEMRCVGGMGKEGERLRQRR